VAAYKKANKTELADEVDKKCEGDIKTLILAKLGRGQLIFILRKKIALFYYVLVIMTLCNNYIQSVRSFIV